MYCHSKISEILQAYTIQHDLFAGFHHPYDYSSELKVLKTTIFIEYKSIRVVLWLKDETYDNLYTHAADADVGR